MQRDAGSSREPQSRSTMSQHVPMSPRARTAADIIIVYSIRPWESGRHCASPPLVCSETFLGEAVCNVSPVRGTRVLDGVSSPRPDSVDSVALCVRTLLGATPIAQRLHASTSDDWAGSSKDFGARRANASDDPTWPRATTAIAIYPTAINSPRPPGGVNSPKRVDRVSFGVAMLTISMLILTDLLAMANGSSAHLD